MSLATWHERRKSAMNLDDMQRAERLYDNMPSPQTTPKDSFVMGYLASKRLSEAEWAEKREQVARATYEAYTSTSWEHLSSRAKAEWRRGADAAMIALGFTRTSEPGGDTC
jgi:hypothetical protein